MQVKTEAVTDHFQLQLPIVTEEQRKEMSLALQELGDDDLEWTNDIISARKNKQYSHT
jgi:hypothetical protein